jgi:hypothetical protein
VKWLSLRIGGQDWRVDLVKGNNPNLSDGGDHYGVTLRDRCKIYIARELVEHAREDTLLHEVLHAAMFVSCGTQELHDACNDVEKAERLEETIVRGLVLVLHPLLKDLGFKFPKGPA